MVAAEGYGGMAVDFGSDIGRYPLSKRARDLNSNEAKMQQGYPTLIEQVESWNSVPNQRSYDCSYIEITLPKLNLPKIQITCQYLQLAAGLGDLHSVCSAKIR